MATQKYFIGRKTRSTDALAPASSDLIQAMIRVYADAQSLYLAAEGSHWNVTGSDFYQLHLLFSRLYESIGGEIDRIAEHVRYLGGKVPFSYQSLQQYSSIAFPSELSSSDAFVGGLIAAIGQFEATCTEAMEVAKANNAEGSINILADLLEQQVGTWNYLLRSFSA